MLLTFVMGKNLQTLSLCCVENLLEAPSNMSAPAFQNNNDGCVDQPFHPRSVKVELPVRVDFVGGWSDTPPWSLERAGHVVNMAITLEGSLPIGTTIETTKSTGVFVNDDAGNALLIEDLASIATPFYDDDPFRLAKSALLVTGVIHGNCLASMGLRIRTWANVPRGSGLGTSSILAAAVVKGLLQITDGDASNENVARLVLVLEQLMGTGGGWQDQIGGLYPGIKFTASFPGIPLRLQVIPLLASPQLVSELQQRLLVVFTGQVSNSYYFFQLLACVLRLLLSLALHCILVHFELEVMQMLCIYMMWLIVQVRLAHQVLHKVVTRYLRRDNLLVSSIKRLTELAKIGREALMNYDIDDLGEIMLEAWRLHQELDPFCSNESVDRLFEFAHPFCCGYKLVGAGGGGFALLLAKDAERAMKLRNLLEDDSSFDAKVYDWNISLA